MIRNDSVHVYNQSISRSLLHISMLVGFVVNRKDSQCDSLRIIVICGTNHCDSTEFQLGITMIRVGFVWGHPESLWGHPESL